MSLDLASEFPWAGTGSPVYCNAASTGPIPTRTRAVLERWSGIRAEPWRVDFEEQLDALREGRERCARLIGADPREIALAPNTSSGINIAANVLDVRANQVILGHDGEFPANVYPWMARARASGARFEQIPLGPDDLPDWSTLETRLARGDVAVVAISWVSFVSGDRADLGRIGALCRTNGVRLAVDAIQGVGAAPLDVHACEVDVLACGAQKWLLSPWGAGFCYVRRELTESVEPLSAGWLSMQASEDFSRMLDYDFTYFDDARRFEVATIAYQDVAGMNASLSLLEELGLDAVASRIAALATTLLESLATVSGVALLTPPEARRRAGIVSVRVRDPQAVSQALDAAGVVHSLRGNGIVRFSPHVYNTDADLDCIVAAVHAALRA